MEAKRHMLCKLRILGVEEEGATEGRFSAYASVFNELNPYYNEIIDKGAFKQTLQHSGGKVAIFYGHSMGEWIGMNERAKEDAKGLLIDGKLDIRFTPRAASIFSLMRMSHELSRPAGISIGFSPVDTYLKAEIEHHKTVALWENSILPPDFQSAPSALVQDLRHSLMHGMDAGSDGLRAIVIDCLQELGVLPSSVSLAADARGHAQLAPGSARAILDKLNEINSKLKRTKQ